MMRSTFVTKLCSLAPLSAADVSAVESLDMKRLAVPRRQEVLPRGARPTFVYTLLSGWAARYEVRRDGGRRITGFLLPGDFCGIHAVCHAAMDHAIVAITNCEVGAVDRDHVAALTRFSQPIFDAIWRAKLIEEAILRKWLVYAADAQQSVGRLLCELHARAAVVGLAEGGRCHIPLTQEEIGDALGLTAVHVNRELTILNAPDLRRIAEFEPGYLEPWLSGASESRA
jgi:CRP-like cAMP-binding protein